ncbi:SDR family NAD(P)-dependent oxidoreductase [Criblamydia sequanensis]|uniref:Short-chain dehydrogenase/reductase n=1 Tax=Candidatus Criblamydia sequanensis CRIB-18 TaxID=1437425 RepID=A0A090CYR6_9BACT|nr:SDR family NAD(P)-dependent oxidoreductase [Criblamydia sequanensis]CDR33812.1 Short-chain dehydrogenase/reductase [Criblamydia sequanensis CRIB-18]
MTKIDWIDQLLDLTILFSFDHSGFKRHCPNPLEKIDLSGKHGIVTGASSGIGLAVSKALLQQGMQCQLIGRDLAKLENGFKSDPFVSQAEFYSLDMSDLKKVYNFALEDVKSPIDLLIHNAGSMPLNLKITKGGVEEMFAAQVLAPFILTKTLADVGKLQNGCRIIFVSSGGMYLQKLDLSDLLFEKRPYNKYNGYANAKRAQVILSELFSQKYPQYLFSSMHPGWVDTPGVRHSMPSFKKLLNKRLRSIEEGADTILWLATSDNYSNGKFWFDRKLAKTTLFNFNQSSKQEKELLWTTCQSILDTIKGPSHEPVIDK